jgi:hypothetical protein
MTYKQIKILCIFFVITCLVSCKTSYNKIIGTWVYDSEYYGTTEIPDTLIYKKDKTLINTYANNKNEPVISTYKIKNDTIYQIMKSSRIVKGTVLEFTNRKLKLQIKEKPFSKYDHVVLKKVSKQTIIKH